MKKFVAIALLTMSFGANADTCADNAYKLGEMVRNLQVLGYSRSATMSFLDQHGIRGMDFAVNLVYSRPQGYWAKGEVGNEVRTRVQIALPNCK